MNKNILIIDDDFNFIKKIEKVLSSLGKIYKGYSKEDFFKLFTPYKYDIILLDLKLDKDKEGIELLRYIKEEDPLVPVVIITGYASIETAIESLQSGAKTYIQKNKVSDKEIFYIVDKYISEKIHQEKIDSLLKSKEKIKIIGESPAIKEVLHLAKAAAEDGEATVLIRGETGTGKELIAKFIHETGKRKDGPFIACSIASLNQSTVISELFGYEKGSFTGATNKHKGYFEQAHKGVLFLDEVAELDLNVQKTLLRVLENRTFRRIGGQKDIEVDCQLITATNADLEEMIKNGKFREDLYYRLKVMEIYIPPLSKRKNDIFLLASYFLQDLYSKGRTTANKFSDNVITIFNNYNWPGNVRELKNVVEFSALKAKLEMCDIITPKHVPKLIKEEKVETIPGDIEKELAYIELNYIFEAMQKSNWKKTEAWKLLGYSSRFALRRKVIKIFKEYPDLQSEFPKIFKIFIDKN